MDNKFAYKIDDLESGMPSLKASKWNDQANKPLAMQDQSFASKAAAGHKIKIGRTDCLIITIACLSQSIMIFMPFVSYFSNTSRGHA